LYVTVWRESSKSLVTDVIQSGDSVGLIILGETCEEATIVVDTAIREAINLSITLLF
jgi:hypothetical protein